MTITTNKTVWPSVAVARNINNSTNTTFKPNISKPHLLDLRCVGMLLIYHFEVLLSMSEHTQLIFMNHFHASVDPYLHTKFNFAPTLILQINLTYRYEVLSAFATMPGHTPTCSYQFSASVDVYG